MTVPLRLCPLAEQTRNRDHDSSDECEQARKQHNVTQEHTHARAFPLSFQNNAGNQLGGCCCRKAGDGGCGSSFLRTRSAKLQLVATSKAAIDWFRLPFFVIAKSGTRRRRRALLSSTESGGRDVARLRDHNCGDRSLALVIRTTASQ
jgi:hypothetical protein